MNHQVTQADFIFWINPWIGRLPFVSRVDRRRVIKCIINAQEIRTEEPISPGKNPLHIQLELIEDYNATLLHDETYINRVYIRTLDLKSYLLVPTNPFEPSLLFHFNRAEALALYSVIKALKEGVVPEYDTNPYLRQLKQKDVPNYVPQDAGTWDENISPWIYYREYRKNAEKAIQIYQAIFNTLLILFLSGVALYFIWYFVFR